MNENKRAVIIVLDSVGIGELPDAGDYGDSGSHTIDNTARAAGGLNLPNLKALGFGSIQGVESVGAARAPRASYGRMREVSAGKDTITGHWEIAGVVNKTPFATFTGFNEDDGFPNALMQEFERLTGYGWLWGRAASGTEIIERFGAQHMETGRLIVYTSADSVFQVAAHTGVVETTELYKICALMRGFFDNNTEKYNIARVIARPFEGKPGAFKRTTRTMGRRDFSVLPPGVTLLDRVKESGLPVVGIGKIGDIFAHRGFTEEVKTKSDMDGVDVILDVMGRVDSGLIFANLNDFDTVYGHRNDAPGYKKALEEVDARLPEIIKAARRKEDMLVITADHGCDPTLTGSTDHCREYVPLLVYGPGFKRGISLGTRESFADLGQTVSEFLGCGALENGVSFFGKIS